MIVSRQYLLHGLRVSEETPALTFHPLGLQRFKMPSLPRPIQRRMARWFGRRLCRIQTESPLISFTFDDFPRSALINAGALLYERGFAGTYYASFGLMGRKTPTGQIFACEDLGKLVSQGLSPNKATEFLSTIIGALVVASALGDSSEYDRATKGLAKR